MKNNNKPKPLTKRSDTKFPPPSIKKNNFTSSLTITFEGLGYYPKFINNTKQEIETMLMNNGYNDKDFTFKLQANLKAIKKEPIKIPTKCKVIKGHFAKEFPKDKNKWQKIEEIDLENGELSTVNYAWVDICDCEFK